MTTLRHTGFWVGMLTAVAVAGAPLVASAGEAHGGGGGGGGAHFSGGGGGAHFSGGGGAHFTTGGHVGFSGHASFGGARPTFAAPHAYYGAGAHFAASANHVYGGYPASSARFASSSHFVARPGGITPARSGFVRPGTAGHGPLVRGSGRFWGGGYWGGRFWPGCHYGPGFAWFLPVLPFGYATYYWGGSPYYYYDGGYYSWSPDYNGYVATDPPPVANTASSSGSDEAPPPADDGQSQSYDVQPQTYAPPPSNPNTVETSAPALTTAQSTAPRGNWSGGVSDIVAYPRNGQNDQQTSNDKFECHKWSIAQTGFDPTRSINLQGTAADYRRAMGACMDARGYTVR